MLLVSSTKVISCYIVVGSTDKEYKTTHHL